ILEMPQHLPRRSAEPVRANEAFLSRQQQRERDGAGQRHARKRQEGAAPADEIAEQARNEAAAESAETRSRDVDAGDARHLRGRTSIADIGDSDREDRRKQQTLRKRQAMSACTSGASAAPVKGTTTANIAAAMTRFLPSTSATAPVNGAVKAMARVLAVMIALISAAPTPNSRASAGSSACGE